MFNYFGSKARLAPTYQAPKYDVIVEPFAGAAGYSMYWLHQRSDLRCVLIDSDPLVVEMWDRLLGMQPSELWLYEMPEAGARSDDPLYLAAAWSSGSWVRRSGGGDYQITDRMVSSFPATRERLAQSLSRVQGRVSVQLGDYSDAPDVEAAWFIDPPYQLDGQYYAKNQLGLDFGELAAWCQQRRGQVVVCESQGADWMDFQPHVANQTLAHTESIEVVWYSHPEPTLFDMMEDA